MNHALLIDAGNTRLKWALAPMPAPQNRQPGRPAYLASGAVAQHDWPALTEQLTAATAMAPQHIWLSNVAGAAAEQALRGALRQLWGHAAPAPRLHSIRAQAAQCGIVNHYTDPAQLGCDRWATLIGARAAFPGEHLLVATLGTAATLESLSATGDFLGGLIAPGPALMLTSLAKGTAQLPTVLPAQLADAPFATDTRAAMLAGCLAAQAGLIERSYAALRARLGEVRCVLTGGAGQWLSTHLCIPHTEHDNLVLAGLFEIAASESNASLESHTL
ncbi:MAG: type III pantothenate kinase [Burkholderiales bacterium]|nr:type III pantothenate kinase [Burkholderiales bacterium]MDE2288042.1 type III pantothenate kinase [Burkholderiales bacterium]